MILIWYRVLFTEKMGKVREREGEEGREKGRGTKRRRGGQREGEGDREKGRGTERRGGGQEGQAKRRSVVMEGVRGEW